MKLKSLTLALVLAAAPFVAAWAADVDGNWTAQMDSPNGPVQLGYTFKADGKTLTGTTTGPDGTAIPIKNGTIDGNKIAFAVDVDFGGQKMTIPYTGEVSPTEIKLKLDFGGMPIDVVAKKAPAAK